MTVAVAHVMQRRVYFAAPDFTVDHVRELMAAKRIHALPVVTANKKAVGIVTTADVARTMDEDTPVANVMSDIVFRVAATDPVAKAARMMRTKRVHHLVVVDGGEAVGILSSFDLLRLVEQKFS
ncbi:MAG: CBS domain-containing protein [Methyloligellaceae bacterium]